MNESEINDIRCEKDFRSCSFSRYKRSDVKKELLNNISQEKIEAACNWSAELVCAGHYTDLWEMILLFMSKNIHLANPKLPSYIDARFQTFRDIVGNGYAGRELAMRNNDKVRRLFCEIVCVLCYSSKKHRFEAVVLDQEESFDISRISGKLKAPNMTYAQDFFLAGDPKEVFIALNEFAYCLSAGCLSSLNACYWVEWAMEFVTKCKQKKEVCKCERRSFANVADKFQMDIIWLFWEVILDYSGRKGGVCARVVTSLFNLFCLRYMAGSSKRRRYLIYFAINLLTETVNFDIPMIPHRQNIERIVSRVDSIYKNIKKNEESPNTDYLFSNTKQTNLDKTVKKMDIMNKYSNSLLPRV